MIETSWIIAAGVVLAIAAFILYKKKKEGGSASSGGYTKHWSYSGDFGTEANEAFDTTLALAMMKARYGTPIFVIGTKSKYVSATSYFKKLSDLAGMKNNIFSEKRGAEEIVKWANKTGMLKIAVGGEFTAISRAVKLDKSIANKIEVFGIGASNIASSSEARAAYDYLRKSGVKMSGWDVPDRGKKEYLQWIRQAAKGDAWIKAHMYPRKVGWFAAKDKMDGRRTNEDHARSLNAGQAGVNTALRVADSATIVALHEGWGKASKLSYALGIAAKGLASMPKR